MSRTPSAARDFACTSCGAVLGAPCATVDADGNRKPISRYHATRKKLAGLDPDPSGPSGPTGAARARRAKQRAKESAYDPYTT